MLEICSGVAINESVAHSVADKSLKLNERSDLN